MDANGVDAESPHGTAAADAPSGSATGWSGLAALSAGQVVSWGILYYALIVASPAIAADTGWPLAAITLSFAGCLVVSAVLGMPVGRLLDRGSPRAVMTSGAVVGAAGLAAVSAAPDLVTFSLAWVVVGVGQSAVLYQAAFTVIARRYGNRRRRAMTVATLAGGLASTIFAPIVVGLLNVTDWRMTFLALAGLLAVTTVPLHWWSLERHWLPRSEAVEQVHTVWSVLRMRSFWLLELSMVALAGSLYCVTLALIPLFMEKGMTYELAALALGLLGVGQVIGRLLYVTLPHASAPWAPLALVAAFGALTLAALALVPGPPWLLVIVGIVAGAVRGAHTLVQGSAVADRWGVANYGSINGLFAAPITVVAALGPALGPVLALTTGSYAAVALIAALVALVALALARWT